MVLALALAVAGTAPSADAGLIAGLGPSSDVASVQAIARSGCRAVPVLVRQLRIGGNQVYHFRRGAPERELRTVWSLATLRYITGQDFYAVQAKPLDGDEARQDMLTLGVPRNKTKMFGIWLSRGAIYFARPSEQASIIRQWQRYSASARCREGQVNKEPMFWLYGISKHYAR